MAVNDNSAEIELLKTIDKLSRENKPCFLNILADELGKTHVAVRSHLDLLEEEGYVKKVNPGGKPVYLKLTKEGEKIIEEFN